MTQETTRRNLLTAAGLCTAGYVTKTLEGEESTEDCGDKMLKAPSRSVPHPNHQEETSYDVSGGYMRGLNNPGNIGYDFCE